MVLGEFELIKKYFQQSKIERKDVDLGIGDDCALLNIPTGYQLAVTTDSLVAGTHFLMSADPHAIGYKALASNISDLAAMGAIPAWISLALTLPKNIYEDWLAAFCAGMFSLANQHNMQLIGGDTTSGSLSITMSVYGFVPQGKALRRDQAQVGDYLYVTGTLGDSLAGLDLILTPPKEETLLSKELIKAHYYSHPNPSFATALLPYAHAAIDISDGLISDLGHILNRSQVSADLWANQLPISQNLKKVQADTWTQIDYALQSGEEYELCFTSSTPIEKLQQLALQHQQKISLIGTIHPSRSLKLRVWDSPKQTKQYSISGLTGFDHFA